MEPTPRQLFSVLVREHETGLLAFVRACVRGKADADDLVQDSFITAWQEFAAYDPARPFAGWLRGIARNKIMAYFRRSGVQRRQQILAPEAVAALVDEFERLNRPARGEVYRDCFAALGECLAALSRQDREVIERAYRESQGCRSIADALGQKVEAIKKRLQRARAELRECIVGKLGPEEVPHG